MSKRDGLLGKLTNYTQHNKSYSKTYKSWAHMIERCTNSNCHNYNLYGGRGIKVNKRWLDFRNFYEDMGDVPLPEYTLDRIDSDGNYTQENCRWSSKKIQARNTRKSLTILFNGVAMSVQEVADLENVSRKTAYNRARSGIYIVIDKFGKVMKWQS